MIDLTKLKVSLTKHGAHKIFRIMKNANPNDVLNHINDTALNIHIDAAQTRKNVSIRSDGSVPQYWMLAKNLGEQNLRLLVLLSICHSHNSIIEALKYSKPRFGNGVVLRGQILDGKEYTNLANNFEELGFSIHHNEQGFEYDFSQAFTLPRFSELYRQMIRDKLVECGMNESADDSILIETATQLELNEALGLTGNEYRSWLLVGTPELDTESDDPFQDVADLGAADQLNFRPGHIKRSSSSLKLQGKTRNVEVSQLHNHIQNRLVEYLEKDFGPEHVGSEQPIGQANRVDVVVAQEGYICFYEIKTAKPARIAIRQALPQLMEYAYRPDVKRADELVVVALDIPTEDDLTYMSSLRNRFGVAVFYMHYSIPEDKFKLFA